VECNGEERMDGGASGEEVARHFRRGGERGRGGRERSGAAVTHVRVKIP